MKYILKFLALIIVFSSCEKIPFNGNCSKPLGKGASSIEIGNEENMIVNIYEVSLRGHRIAADSFSIDIDNDCTDDLKFKSEVWGSAGLGNHGIPKIEILNDKYSIHYEEYSDTTYYHFESHFNEFEGQVSWVTNERYLCSEKTDSLQKINLGLKRVKELTKGQVLDVDADFESIEFDLAQDNVGYTQSWGYMQDTAFTHYVFYENECHNFPDSEVAYIGVKYKKGLTRKLGWIKLILFDGFEILLLESGIED